MEISGAPRFPMVGNFRVFAKKNRLFWFEKPLGATLIYEGFTYKVE
jgi:hypothetical protein